MPVPGINRWRRLGGAHKGVAAILSSTAGGQLVTLAATPFLTRLYSPADFGVFAVLVSIVVIAATVGSLRLEFAIPVCSPAEARVLVRIALTTSLLAGLGLVPLVLTGEYAQDAQLWGGSRGVGLALLVIVYLVWVTSAYTVLTNYALRQRTYGAVARRNFLQALGTAGGQLALARWLPSSIGLTLGLALGRSIGVLSLVRETRLARRDVVSAPQWRAVLGAYWRYPAVFLPAGLMNELSLQFPILLVGFAYSAPDAGNLSQAIRLTAVPAALLGGAVSSVVMAEMAHRVREGTINNRVRYLKASKALLPIAIGWAAVLLLAAPWVLPALLGEGWVSSGLYAAVMAPSVGLSVLVSPLTMVLPVYEKSLLQLGLDGLRLLLVCGSGVTAWSVGAGPVAAVMAMSLCLAAVYVVTWFAGLKVVSGKAIRPRLQVLGLRRRGPHNHEEAE